MNVGNELGGSCREPGKEIMVTWIRVFATWREKWENFMYTHFKINKVWH